MVNTSFDWNRLKIFHAVAEANSFTEAGRRLHLSQSAVSRQIAALEENFGIPLFHRHARGLVLTEAGEGLLETAKELATRLLTVEGMLKEGHAQPKGRLKLFASIGLGGVWLTSRIHKFMEMYPDIDLTMMIDDYSADLTKAEADAGIQVRPPNQPGIIQRVFATYTVGLYASKEYLEKFGTPKKPQDLDDHKIIVYGSDDAIAPYPDVNWALLYGREDGTARKPALRINNIYALMNATSHGAGIASLPDYMTLETSNLVRLFPNETPAKLQAYFVYPEALRNSKRIAILRDFLVSEAKNTKFLFV